MEDNIYTDNVRSKLVLAGLSELEKHGVADFSLRRVAKEAGVSCAAPYRHFKDKDELIASVIDYVLEGWTLLSDQICGIFANDASALLTELAVAGLRFWIANGNFRTVIMASTAPSASEQGTLAKFDFPFTRAAELYAGEKGRTEDSHLPFKILSMLYGAVILVDSGFATADVAADNLRAALVSELS